ncbi:hypothetical protein GQ600_1855 [Phytophthora cactorum]|nr:hypothetical protein GQ600_1855 [Phytophthora cactorum]
MAHNIIQEFLNKITHIKSTSVKQLGSLVQEDIKQARKRAVYLQLLLWVARVTRTEGIAGTARTAQHAWRARKHFRSYC